MLKLDTTFRSLRNTMYYLQVKVTSALGVCIAAKLLNIKKLKLFVVFVSGTLPEILFFLIFYIWFCNVIDKCGSTVFKHHSFLFLMITKLVAKLFQLYSFAIFSGRFY